MESCAKRISILATNAQQIFPNSARSIAMFSSKRL